MITLNDVILERKNNYTYVKLKNSIFIIKKNNIVLKNYNNNYLWLYKVNYNSILNKYSEEKLINNLSCPMGKDKTLKADLSRKFLSNVHRLKIQTYMEIY